MTAATVPSERIDAGAPQAAAADAILVVDDIVKRFETPDGVLVAVDRISLSVAPGEFLGVIGPSGCGKSTLFNIIGGLLDADEGTVKVAGERVSGPHRVDRHDLPGGIDLSLAQRDRQRGVPAGDRRPAQIRALRPRPAFRRAGRARRLRAALSGGALGRHAPARVDGAHAGGAAENPADGRAVRLARRADAAPARRQGAADPAGAQADHAADHPQHHRGGAVVRPHPGDDLSAWKDEADRGDQAAAPAHLRDRVERGVRTLRGADLERPARGSDQGPARGGNARSCARARNDDRCRGARARAGMRRCALGILSFVVFVAAVELLIRIERHQPLHRADAVRHHRRVPAHHRRRGRAVALPAHRRRSVLGVHSGHHLRRRGRRAAPSLSSCCGARPRPGWRRSRRPRWC